MAIILRGKEKGKVVEINQWCNDWVTVEGSAKVFPVSGLQFTRIEFNRILTSENLGMMLTLYRPDWNLFRFFRRKQ